MGAMNNSLKKNPFFYATAVLAGLLIFELAGIVAAQYVPPSASPTGGMPAAPLNAGVTAQTKTGSLTVNGGTNGVKLDASGLLQFVNSVGTPLAGIRYNGTSVQYSNNMGTWQDIGTGGGSAGSNYWVLDNATKNILYADGDVVVGKFGHPPVTTWVYVTTNVKNQWTDSHVTPCRVTDTADRIDCPSYVPNASSPTTAYDNWTRIECKNGEGEPPGCTGGPREGVTVYYYTRYNLQQRVDNGSPISRNIAVNGNILASGIQTYPTLRGKQLICVDDRAAIRYRTDGTLSWVEIGGVGPANESVVWQKNCPGPVDYFSLPKWRWNRTTGNMALQVFYAPTGDCPIPNFESANYWTITKAMADGDVFPGKRADCGAGVSAWYINYTLGPDIANGSQQYE